MKELKIAHEIEITTTSVLLDGKAIAVEQTGEKMLVELYRCYVGDYPKFFKMDTLSRLGFIAAELLIKMSEFRNQKSEIRDQQPVDAVILANRSASIKNDTDYLATITDGNYYPSPALFVYTLPNIVTGEIAIRHHIQGETAFYILNSPDELKPIIASTLNANPLTHSPLTALVGWCECNEPNMFYAKMQLIWNN